MNSCLVTYFNLPLDGNIIYILKVRVYSHRASMSASVSMLKMDIMAVQL